MNTRFAILTLAVVVSLASCSKSDQLDPNPNFPTDGVIRVSTGVDVPTRNVDGQNTDNLSLFNIYVKNPIDPNYSYYACMKRDLKTPESTWDSYSAENDGTTKKPMLWKDSETSIEVTALGANKCLNSKDFFETCTYAISQNQTTEELFKANDILYMKRTPINPKDQNLFKSGGLLKLKLSHGLSKLIIHLTIDPSITVEKMEDIIDFRVVGTMIGFTFDPAIDQGPTVIQDVAKLITPLLTDYTLAKDGNPAVFNYACVVVPQTLANNKFTLLFTLNDKLYRWISKDQLQFKTNGAYEVSMLLKQDVVTVRSLSTREWDQNSSRNDKGN